MLTGTDYLITHQVGIQTPIQPAFNALSLSPSIEQDVMAIIGISPSISDPLILLEVSRPSITGRFMSKRLLLLGLLLLALTPG